MSVIAAASLLCPPFPSGFPLSLSVMSTVTKCSLLPGRNAEKLRVAELLLIVYGAVMDAA